MAYLLKRISTVPNSPMRIMVSDPVNGPMLNAGGTFYFAPEGQDGDQAEVSERVATAVMTDPELAVHFSCSPPFEWVQPEQPAASKEVADAGAVAPATDDQPRRRRRKAAAGAAE